MSQTRAETGLDTVSEAHSEGKMAPRAVNRQRGEMNIYAV
jgi:hypothetical protein